MKPVKLVWLWLALACIVSASAQPRQPNFISRDPDEARNLAQDKRLSSPQSPLAQAIELHLQQLKGNRP